MNRIRSTILDSLQNNPLGFMKMFLNFSELDIFHKLKVSWNELNHCLLKSDIFLSIQDMRDLFNYFDTFSTSFFDYYRFITFLRGDLSEKRKRILTNIFHSLNKNVNNIHTATHLSLDDVKLQYNNTIIMGSLFLSTSRDLIEKYFAINNGQLTINEFILICSFLTLNNDDDDKEMQQILEALWKPKSSHSSVFSFPALKSLETSSKVSIPILETSQVLCTDDDPEDGGLLKAENELIPIPSQLGPVIISNTLSKSISLFECSNAPMDGVDSLRDEKSIESLSTISRPTSAKSQHTPLLRSKRFGTRRHLESSVGDLLNIDSMSLQENSNDGYSRNTSSSPCDIDTTFNSYSQPHRASFRKISNTAFKSSISSLLSPETTHFSSNTISTHSYIPTAVIVVPSVQVSSHQKTVDLSTATVPINIKIPTEEPPIKRNIDHSNQSIRTLTKSDDSDSEQRDQSIFTISTTLADPTSASNLMATPNESTPFIQDSDHPNSQARPAAPASSPNLIATPDKYISAVVDTVEPEQVHTGRSLASILATSQHPLSSVVSQSRPSTGRSTIQLGDDGEDSTRIKRKQGQQAMHEVKVQALSKGVRGLVTLRRAFRSVDPSGSGHIPVDKFRRVLESCHITLTDKRFYELIDWLMMLHCEVSYSIHHKTFFLSLLGEISARRLNSMNVVFSMLDSSKQGKLAPEELIRQFDASQHPDCTSFRRTIDQIRNEFLDTFDVGATVDRFVTRTDFIDYYSIVSVTITDDSQFDLMMRQVWHVPMCTTIAHAYYNKPTQINWTSDDNNNDNSITGVHRHQFRSVE